MKITAKVINEASMKQTLKEFSKLTGKGIEEGVKAIATATGRALATKIRPYGLTAKVGQKFQDNIREQVMHVRYGVNVGYYAGEGMADAHEKARRKGRVRIRKIRASGWDDKISVGEMEAHARRKQGNAGIAKAGWVAATQQATGKVMNRVAGWISRHIGKGDGTGRMIKTGAKTEIELANNVKYLSEAQSNTEIASGLAAGRRNGLKYMLTSIEKEIAKLNR